MKKTFKCVSVPEDVLYVDQSATTAGGSFLNIMGSSVSLTPKQALRLAALLIRNTKGVLYNG